eukprot:NODE_6709_length_488_cov_742.972286.p2 GENE.NODE_6709_length_488_cov_742.972286~~NODE_6709_length_488_cov_742.972286.p2  ORF type:complete len:110 (+),score=25.05 NODE_6709_length_488_cov_742.972286:3-332(+)
MGAQGIFAVWLQARPPSPVMAAKEVAHVFRWSRAFAKFKTPAAEVPPLSRYTNFTLNHAWEKFDCQTTLLCKEALLPLAKRNPALFDAELDHAHTVRLSLSKPQHSAIE